MGTAFEDLAGVDVGDTLFVGDPWKIDREAPFLVVHQTGRAQKTNIDCSECASHLCWRPERAKELEEMLALLLEIDRSAGHRLKNI